MTLIFKYKAKYVICLPFVFSFSQHLLRLVCDVTCCSIFVSPAKQKRDICTAFPASSLSSSLSSSSSAAA